MRLPKLEKPDKYVGLYIFDFGDHVGVGFTRAYPDGKLELKGVPAERFQLEAGMFFYAPDLETARQDFDRLFNLAVTSSPPCRAKLHLARHSDDKFVVALIYPAEYDDEVSAWLLDGQYMTSGAAEGGAGAVQRYYNSGAEILDRQQLFGRSQWLSRTGDELLASLKVAVQR